MAEDDDRSMTPPPTDLPAATAPNGQIERAFALLQLVAASPTALGVRELGRQTGLAKSTVSRILATLESLGMVERLPSGAVLPGPGLDLLQPAAGRPTPRLRDELRPLLVQLTDRFGEAAALSIDDGDRILYLDEVASDSAVQVPESSGQRFPFHTVAGGLVLMAAWDDSRLDAYLSEALESPTEHSVVDPDEIRHRIRYVRRRGYVWTNQELDLEVNGLGVPVLDATGAVVAAVSLHGPAYRLAESLAGSMIIADQLRADVERFRIR